MAGKVTSEGDRALRSDVARELFDVDGRGIQIGIISTSFNALNGATTDISSGDLPGVENPNGNNTPVRVLKDFTNTQSSLANDEGRALAQIVHDVAPGAELLFHTAAEGEGQEFSAVNNLSYSTAVKALADAGADIIVDDARFPSTLFQDGIAAQAVDEVVKQGITYVSAAGNDGDRSYESQYRAGKTFSVGGSTFEAHDFDAGDGIDLFQDIQVSRQNTLIRPLLSWDEPSGQVTSDLEMFLLDSPNLPGSGGNVLSVSTIPSTETVSDPLKTFAYAPTENQNLYLAIARRVDSPTPPPSQIKWITVANGLDRNTTYQYVNDSTNAADGSTVYGQANAEGAIAVGASDYTTTPVFGGSVPEQRDYSSRGGTPILFDLQGRRLLVPEVRQKPDVFAPDEVSTTFDTSTNFNPFSGTSAAAPHIAGVAALMQDGAGGERSLSPQKVQEILRATAIPLSPQEGISSDAGFVQADRAVTASLLSELSETYINENIQVTAGLTENGDPLLSNTGNSSFVESNSNDLLLGSENSDRSTLDNILLGENFPTIQNFQEDRNELNSFSSIEISNSHFFQQGIELA
jgi:hypothetical protein